MNNRGIHIVLTVLLVIFAGSYSFYVGVRYFHAPYRTETAFEYTVADHYRTKALAVREEQVIFSDAQGVLNYVCADGEVVIPGTVIAQSYSDEQDLRWQTLIGLYKREIALLTEAQNTPKQYSGADMLSAQINDAVGETVGDVAKDDLSRLSQQRDRLQLLLGRKQIVTGRETDFMERITYLKSQQEYAQSRISQQHDSIKTTVGGYFCSTTDGYETLISPQKPLTAAEYRKILEGSEDPPTTSGVGRVQIDHNWYLIAVVAQQDAARFVPGAPVTLDFEMENCRNVPASIHQVSDPDSNGWVIVQFRCNRINKQLIAMRKASVDIRFQSYTGLKISPKSIRFDGQSEGVYVLQGGNVTFKTIQKVYAEESFVLCEPGNEKTPNALSLFDEVIVEGVDLYDGKIIK